MIWNSSRRGYHHGNLREALVQAALALIAEKGPSGFSFAEASRAAGVSPAAPYRHFRDRDALMADVATRGFERFAETLKQAWRDGKPDPVRAFVAMGRAYIAFARSEPALYAAMFEAALPRGTYPALDEAGNRAFAVVRDASEAVVATLPAGRTATGADDQPSCLVDGAWHRRPVRARRFQPAAHSDVGRGPPRGRDAHLLRRPAPACVRQSTSLTYPAEKIFSTMPCGRLDRFRGVSHICECD